MIKKHYYSWTDIERMCVSIVNQMYTDNWRPDYIVGLTRGGNVPATIISNMTGIRCEALKVSLRDDDSKAESNFGCPKMHLVMNKERRLLYKNILIVDDINDTGATFNWIKEDWPSGCMPMEHDRWNAVWGGNVRFATLTDNGASNAEVPVSYTCHEINKAEEDVWLVYPWENVSEY